MVAVVPGLVGMCVVADGYLFLCIFLLMYNESGSHPCLLTVMQFILQIHTGCYLAALREGLVCGGSGGLLHCVGSLITNLSELTPYCCMFTYDFASCMCGSRVLNHFCCELK